MEVVTEEAPSLKQLSRKTNRLKDAISNSQTSNSKFKDIINKRPTNSSKLLELTSSKSSSLVINSKPHRDIEMIASEIANAPQEATDKEVVETIGSKLKTKYKNIKPQTISYMIVSNRKAIAKEVAKWAIRVAVTIGISYAIQTIVPNIMPVASAAASAAASSGLPSTFLSFYIWMRKLGLDKVAINRVFQLMKNNKALGGDKPLFKIPEFMLKNGFTTKILNPIYNSTAYTIGEKLVSEGIAFAVDGPTGYIQNTAISYTLNKALPGAKNIASSAAIKVVNVYRKITDISLLSKQSKIITKQAKIGKAIDYMAKEATTELQSTLSEGEKSTVNAIDNSVHRDLGTVINYMNNKPEDSSKLAKAVTNVANVATYATSVGTAIALNIYLNKNEALQSAAMSMILSSSGIDNYIAKLGSSLTLNTLGKLFDIKQQIQLDPNNSSGLKKQLFSLILGETIYTDSAIDKMNKVEIKKIMVQKNVHKSKYPRANASAEVWREALKAQQLEILAVTREFIIETLAQNLLKATANGAIVKAINTGVQNYESIINEVANSSYLSGLANLTKEEISAIISSKVGSFIPSFGKRDVPLDPVLESGQRKIDELLVNNPELAQELTTNPFIETPLEPIVEVDPNIIGTLPDGTVIKKSPEPEINTNQRETVRKLREERRNERLKLEELETQQREIYKTEQIRKYTTKYKIPEEIAVNIKTREDLEIAIRNKLQGNLQDTNVGPAAKFGTLKDEDLLDRDTANTLKNIEIDPLYNTVKRYTVSNAASWIPGYGLYTNMVSNINLGIDNINFGKNVYNVGLALKKTMFRSTDPDNYIDNLPFAPLANIDKIKDLGEVIAEKFEYNKLNAYELVLGSIKDKIVNGWDNKQFIVDLATKMVGKDAASKDLDKAIESLKIVLDKNPFY